MLDTSTPVLSADEANEYAVLRVKNPPPAATTPAPAPAPISNEAVGSEVTESTPEAEATTQAGYYWETPNAEVSISALPVVVIHHVHYWFSRVYSTAEVVGDFFAEFFGLYNSRYEWAMELERRHREEAEEREFLEERKKRFEEMKRLNGGKPMVGIPVQPKPAGGGATASTSSTMAPTTATASDEVDGLLAKEKQEGQKEELSV